MLDILMNLVLVLLGIPVTMFVLECLLGLKPPKTRVICKLEKNPTAVVLVPAHNEEAVIARTLDSLATQVTDADRVVVVADNCQDHTASIVRARGFAVVERVSETERGKGYALAFGVEYVRSSNLCPDIVVIIDADCLLAPGALSLLKSRVMELQCPVQACYLMRRGSSKRLGLKVSEFAFLVKNKIRLRGLARLGLPVPLTGTGMAFPWDAISNSRLATGDIVEDMRLGVELVERGNGATYCDEACVYSFFPTSEEAETSQRERWEHGHLSTLRQFVPRLLIRAVSACDLKSLGMAFDLVIPPLSLLVMLVLVACFAFAGLGLISGQWYYFNVSAAYLMLLSGVTGLTWFFHGRLILSGRELAHIPIYVFTKITIYIAYLLRKQTKWIKTDRN